MKQKTLDFLEAHKSEQPSTFTEDAKWRQEVVQTSPTNLVCHLSMLVAFFLAVQISHSRVLPK